MRRLRRSLLAFAPLAGCSPARLAGALTPRGGIEEAQDLPYGPLPAQRMDLYAPQASRQPSPIVVFVYGGGWKTGARGEYAFAARPLARLGVTVAVPDYRLFPEAAFPAFVEDVALAVRALAAREPGRPLVLMGHSAGAFNAAAAALDPRWGARDLVAGFIGLAGPYDFRADEVDPPAIFAGLTRIQAVPDAVDLRGAPPMLLLHGADDRTVGPFHSRILADRARAAGVPVHHVVFPRMGHVGIVAALAAPVRALGLEQGDVLEEVAGFLAGFQPAPA